MCRAKLKGVTGECTVEVTVRKSYYREFAAEFYRQPVHFTRTKLASRKTGVPNLVRPLLTVVLQC